MSRSRQGLPLKEYEAPLTPGEPPLAAAKRRRAEAFRVEQRAREQARRDAEVAAAEAAARAAAQKAERAAAAVPKPAPVLQALPKPEIPGFLPVAPVYVGGIGSHRVSFFGPERGQNPERVEPGVSIQRKRTNQPRAGHGYGSPIRSGYRP